MGTTDVLSRSLQHTHTRLAERLEAARAMAAPPGEPRGDRQRIDAFLGEASKHLHAIDAVLVPEARRVLSDGGSRVHDYLHAAKELEVVLAHVKAHEYGSVYETQFAWPAVWSDVDEALAEQFRREHDLGELLAGALDDDELDRLAQRLHDAELAAPSRPHPYTPHTGLPGVVARRVMHLADRFWDAVEGRMVPEPEQPPKPPPGRLAQYLLADPHFDPRYEEDRAARRARRQRRRAGARQVSG
ncbi:hypothetical protein [Nocardioides sp.]|uniref:hypothetical protein n=1 Tax=Nocardioides sp. TaxID=35761 RepID=UPI002ED7D992